MHILSYGRVLIMVMQRLLMLLPHAFPVLVLPGRLEITRLRLSPEKNRTAIFTCLSSHIIIFLFFHVLTWFLLLPCLF